MYGKWDETKASQNLNPWSLTLMDSKLVHPMLTSRITVWSPSVSLLGLVSAHCDRLRLRQSRSEAGAGVWSPEPEPRPGPRPRAARGQSRYDDLLWLSLLCTFTTAECFHKKDTFRQTSLRCRVETLTGHLVNKQEDVSSRSLLFITQHNSP